MTVVERAIDFTERTALPDLATKAGVAFLVGRMKRQLADGSDDSARRFAEDMRALPVALATDAANAQHYEIPPEFFELFLGHRRKYSCGYYESAQTTLDQAEDRALALSAEHAGIEDGQTVLELGCGWGSLTLWIARHYPSCRIMAVSNSTSQRAFIERSAAREGLDNIEVVTADMNAFQTERRFDRVVSVEMFEHMSNWWPLFENIATRWLAPDGRFFMHIFTHRTAPYRFDHTDKSDWIAQHFFTGGIMPSHGLVGAFSDLLTIEKDWRWSGTHYHRTAADWLSKYDANEAAIDAILVNVYGADARLWKRRWRLFFLATAGLFGHDGGSEWGVSHYRMQAV